MSANISFSRLERNYVQGAAIFGTIPNSSGTATVSNSNCLRFIRTELQNSTALLERQDKTGSLSQEGLVGGRRSGRWSIEMNTVANGTAGVVPDCDPILQALFGQSASVGAGAASITTSTNATPIVLSFGGAHGIASGSFEVCSISGHATNTNANGVWLCYANNTTSLTLVGSTGNGVGSGGTLSRVKLTYSFLDTTTNYFALWSFRTPATLDQRVANTCIVSEATFNLNQDVASWTASGDCLWVARSSDFANYDTTQTGGLTSFPTEPASPVTNGVIIPGFTGRFVAWQSVASTSAAAFAANAQTFGTIRNVSVRLQTPRMLVMDTFGSYYATTVEADVRNISVSFNIYDDDSTAVNTIKNWGDEKVPLDFYINLGTNIGNVWVFCLKNVYLANHVLGDGQLRFDAAYADSRATTTTLAVRDEFTLVID
jgi:hypothetical protein